MNNKTKSEVIILHWPLNYPGDEYLTNVFGQVIILCKDIKDTTLEFVDNVLTEISDKMNDNN